MAAAKARAASAPRQRLARPAAAGAGTVGGWAGEGVSERGTLRLYRIALPRRAERIGSGRAPPGTLKGMAMDPSSTVDAPTPPVVARPRPPTPMGATGAPRRPRRHWRRRVLAALVAVGLGVLAITGATWAVTPGGAHVLQRVAAIDRAHHGTPLQASGVPRQLAQALVATEDAQFYRDNGIDLQALARAAFFDVTHGCACQGGSTITEQLAEDLYFNGNDATLLGRWQDMIVALKINGHLSKGQILAAYLSEVYLGHGAYGAIAASQVYFHRPVGQDTLGQAALLAGLPQAPSAYDPIRHPNAARLRRREVLAQMVADGYITRGQAARANAAPV